MAGDAGYQRHVYVVTEGGGGFQILSLADPDAPVLVGAGGLPGGTNTHSVSLDVGAAKVYFAGTSVGMPVFDLAANPANPAFAGAYTDTFVHESFVQNGRAYLACQIVGELRILDVSALPAMPLLGSTTTPLFTTHIAAANEADTIAITTNTQGGGWIQVYDVTNPASPAPLGSDFLPSVTIHTIELVDDKILHVAHFYGSYRALDVSDPNALGEIGHDNSLSAWGAYSSQPSGTIYVTSIPATGGLFCLRLACGAPRRYGAGTAGSGGLVPGIDWDGGYPRVANGAFQIEGDDMPGGAPAALVLGTAPASLPIAGATLLVAPPLVFLPVTTSGAGSAAVLLAIPNNSALANGTVYAQWGVLDPGAPLGIAGSRGMEIAVCP